MKNKIFSRGIYAEGMRRLRIFGLIVLSVGLLAEIAPPLIQRLDNSKYIGTGYMGTPDTVGFFAVCYALPVIVLAIVPLMTLLLFASFDRRAYCDFCHSLPYTRPCIFISNVAAVLTWTVGLMLICGAAGVGIRLAMPQYYAVSFAGYGMYILTALLTALYMCFTVTLAASLTGTVFSNITLAALILAFPRFMLWMVTNQINGNLPLLCGNAYTPILSPRYNPAVSMFLNSYGVDRTLTDSGPIIYSAVIVVLYAALSVFFFVRRKSELAGSPAPGKFTQAVVRICLAMMPATLGTLLVMNGETYFGIVLYVLAVIVYFSYEILSTLKWRNIVRALPALGAVVVLNLAVFGIITCATTVARNYRPEAEDVSSVRIMNLTGTGNDAGLVTNAISKVEITDKETVKTVTDALKFNLDFYNDRKALPYSYAEFKNSRYKEENTYIQVTVALKYGCITRYRFLCITPDELDTIAKRLAENDEYREAAMTLPKAVYGSVSIGSLSSTGNIPQKELMRVIDVFQDEIRENGFETWMRQLMFEGSFYDSRSICDRMFIRYGYGTSDNMMQLPISANLYPKTFKAVCDLTWDTFSELDDVTNVMDKALGGADEVSDYEYWSVTVTALDKRSGESKNYSLSAYGGSDAGSGYEADANSRALQTAAALFSEAKEQVDGIGDDGVICVDIVFDNYASNDPESVYASFYMPIPDGYDFAAAGFEEIEVEATAVSEVVYN